MKNNFLNIILCCMALVIYACAGDSATENDSVAIPTESAKEESDVIYTELEEQSTELTSEQKEAFQLRAIQKFHDLTDYLEIISDPAIEEDLVEHSRNLTEELFINDSIAKSSTGLIWLYALFNSENADSLNRHPKINHWPQIFIKTKNIEFITPLEVDSTNKYNGVMKAIFIVNGKKINNNIDVHLIEIEKFFGDSSQFITEVRLGNIY